MPVLFPLLIIVVIAVIAVLVFGCSASMIGYGLLKTTAKFGSSAPAPSPQQPQPSGSGWAIQYSKNVPTQMTRASDGTYFVDLPNQDGLHYVVQNAPSLSIGQIVSMTFSISGDGTILPVQTDDTPPATLRLYMQRAGDNMSGTGAYQQYRYWGTTVTNLVNGDFTVSIPLNVDQWTDVFGKSDSQTGFIGCVSNAAVIGFTFGGQYFAGHGVYVSGGNARFTLKSFTIT